MSKSSQAGWRSKGSEVSFGWLHKAAIIAERAMHSGWIVLKLYHWLFAIKRQSRCPPGSLVLALNLQDNFLLVKIMCLQWVGLVTIKPMTGMPYILASSRWNRAKSRGSKVEIWQVHLFSALKRKREPERSQMVLLLKPQMRDNWWLSSKVLLLLSDVWCPTLALSSL